LSNAWTAPPGAVLRFCFELPLATPSNNEIKGMNHFVYRTLRRRWQVDVFLALNGRRPGQAIELSFLAITRRCSGGGLDWDNAYGGLKPLLDCLVAPSVKNPDGLGLIRDDSPGSMPLPPLMRQESAPPKKGSTLVEIYELFA
jgi:hypothetical protein